MIPLQQEGLAPAYGEMEYGFVCLSLCSRQHHPHLASARQAGEYREASMQLRKHLSTYRDPLKGFAILWVCLFHAKLGLEHIPFIGSLQKIGYMGVDIFLLLSGMGLAHSLAKAPSAGHYLQRRAVRLLPAFLPVCILWCLHMIPALKLTGWPAVHTILGNLTMTGYLAGSPYMLNWYLTLLLVTILLAPVVFFLLKGTKKPYLICSLLLMAAFACAIPMIGRVQMMLFSRLPIFILGMGLQMIKPKKMIQALSCALCWLGVIAGSFLLWLGFARYPDAQIAYGLYWYPAFLMIPGLCSGLSWFMDKLTKLGWQMPFLTLLGKSSFEIFLFNAWFELYCKRVLNATEPLVYLGWMLLSIALGLLWHWLVTVFMKQRKNADL